ncbi:MAG TPA: HAD family hydrolase [Acidimicrobiia bacterium]|nr:HAD family hydrolase [Acidimicrobiia bacterium]
MIKMAVLDIGGTTVREEGAVVGSFREALGLIGVSGSSLDDAMETVIKTMGRSKLEVFNMIVGDDRLAVEGNREFEEAIDRRIDAGEMTAMPGAVETIEALKEAGIAVVIATGFSAATRDRLLDHLGWSDLPDLVASPGGRVRGRPYPDLILDSMITLKIKDVRDVAVVGDTVNDLRSGHRAGASVVAGVLTGTHDRARLESAPHTHILESIVELPAVLI